MQWERAITHVLKEVRTCSCEIRKANKKAPAHSATMQNIISGTLSALMSPKPTVLRRAECVGDLVSACSYLYHSAGVMSPSVCARARFILLSLPIFSVLPLPIP